MVWMLYSSYKDIPPEILEAARMDGANLWTEFRHVVLPLSVGGLASTGLLCLVLSWNEAFWALNLSSAKAGTLADAHRLVLEPRRPVLGQALGRLADGHRADRGVRLVQPEAARPRPDLRRSQVTQRRQHPMAYLQLDNIKKSFGDAHIIKGVDLEIDKGEFIVFVGPSGCGKSTLLRLIAGLEPITSGQLHARRQGHHEHCPRASATWRWCSRAMRSIRT